MGIHAIAAATSGVQCCIGSDSRLDADRDVYVPTLSIGYDARLGVIQANSVLDNGIAISSPVDYPATAMPPLPLALIGACRGDDRNVAAGDVDVFVPGDYGAVTVHGILLLIPGSYCFSSLTMTNGAHCSPLPAAWHSIFKTV